MKPTESVLCASQTILVSPKYHCTEEILTIISLLSVDSVLYNPPSRRDEVQAVRKKFISSEGDHLTLLSVYRAFKSVSGNKVGDTSAPADAKITDFLGDMMLRLSPCISVQLGSLCCN